MCECNDGFDGDGTACTGTFNVTMKILGLFKRQKILHGKRERYLKIIKLNYYLLIK